MPEIKDEVRMTILEDGTISVSTQAFSPENHYQAEELIATTFKELGGDRKVVGKNKPGEAHTHVHQHDHSQQKTKA